MKTSQNIYWHWEYRSAFFEKETERRCTHNISVFG
jgi:hypothetical protein